MLNEKILLGIIFSFVFFILSNSSFAECWDWFGIIWCFDVTNYKCQCIAKEAFRKRDENYYFLHCEPHVEITSRWGDKKFSNNNVRLHIYEPYMKIDIITEKHDFLFPTDKKLAEVRFDTLYPALGDSLPKGAKGSFNINYDLQNTGLSIHTFETG